MSVPDRSYAGVERMLYARTIREVQLTVQGYLTRLANDSQFGGRTDYEVPLVDQERATGWQLIGLGIAVLGRVKQLHGQLAPDHMSAVEDKVGRLQAQCSTLTGQLGNYNLQFATSEEMTGYTLTAPQLAALEARFGPALIEIGFLFLACADERESEGQQHVGQRALTGDPSAACGGIR